MNLQNRVLLVFPFALEARDVLNSFPWIARQGHWEFETPKGHFFLIICGQGKVNCAVEITDWGHRLGITEVLLCGSAGYLGQDKIDFNNTLFISHSICEGDFKSFMSSKAPTWQSEESLQNQVIEMAQTSGLNFEKCNFLSQDCDVNDSIERAELAHKFACQLISWEGAGLVKAAKKLGIQWLEIRFVSDTENLLTPKAFKEAVLKGSKLHTKWLQGVLDGH